MRMKSLYIRGQKTAPVMARMRLGRSVLRFGKPRALVLCPSTATLRAVSLSNCAVEGSAREIFIIVVLLLFAALSGCESVGRKFIRKPKKDKMAASEMVIAPEEYAAPGLTAAEGYKQDLLYWSSWHDELIFSLGAQGNRKRQLYCLDEAANNLRSCVEALDGINRSRAEGYLGKLSELRKAIETDIYGTKGDYLRRTGGTIEE